MVPNPRTLRLYLFVSFDLSSSHLSATPLWKGAEMRNVWAPLSSFMFTA